MTLPGFILASASPARRKLLENAGLDFSVDPASIDERAAEKPLAEAGTAPDDIAVALAMVKAEQVSHRHPGRPVVGADQTLDLDGTRLNKPEDMEAARRQLLAMRGRTHRLHAGLAVARDGDILWTHVETASLTMRDLDPAEIGRYLAEVGDTALASVGAYQIEGRGVRLFKRIEGDFFAILGFPLLPFLAFLRTLADGEGT